MVLSLITVSLRYRTGIGSFEERRIILPENTTINEILDAVNGDHANLYTSDVRTPFNSGEIKRDDVLEIWGSEVDIIRSYCKGYTKINSL
jgi:hypothetical protein